MNTHDPQSVPFISSEERLRARIAFLLELAEALHRYGTPAHRLEETLARCCEQFGLTGHFFSTPTSIIAAFGEPPQQHTALLRIDPGDVDLEGLIEVDAIADRVARGDLAPRDGAAELARLERRPVRYGPVETSLCFAMASGCAARFFGSGYREIIASTVAGFLVGLVALVAQRHRRSARLLEFAAGVIAASVALLASLVLGDLSAATVTLSGLIVLMPGLTITLSMNELATKNLVSGTARFMGAMTIFISMGVGVALGRQLQRVLPVPVNRGSAGTLPDWTEAIALVLAPVAFTVLFRARPKDFLSILAASVIAFAGARYGAIALGPEIGVGLGAFLVGLAGNAYSRLNNKPSAVPTLPGIMILVPGAIGFRSLDALMSHDVLSGVETAFHMILVATSLVAGLLLANVALPSRRSL